MATDDKFGTMANITWANTATTRGTALASLFTKAVQFRRVSGKTINSLVSDQINHHFRS